MIPMSKAVPLIGFLLALVVIGGAIIVSDLNETVQESNERLQIGRMERTELHYMNLLIGCATEKVPQSVDPEVRRICDERLDVIRERLERLQDRTNGIYIEGDD